VNGASPPPGMSRRMMLGITSIGLGVISLLAFTPATLAGAGAAVAGLVLSDADESKASLWVNIAGLVLNTLMIGMLSGMVLVAILRR
jgi:hypothetical protein